MWLKLQHLRRAIQETVVLSISEERLSTEVYLAPLPYMKFWTAFLRSKAESRSSLLDQYPKCSAWKNKRKKSVLNRKMSA